jgi:hypothetical protein
MACPAAVHDDDIVAALEHLLNECAADELGTADYECARHSGSEHFLEHDETAFERFEGELAASWAETSGIHGSELIEGDHPVASAKATLDAPGVWPRSGGHRRNDDRTEVMVELVG